MIVRTWAGAEIEPEGPVSHNGRTTSSGDVDFVTVGANSMEVPATPCFGASGAPPERDCTPRPARMHQTREGEPAEPIGRFAGHRRRPNSRKPVKPSVALCPDVGRE